MTTSVQTLPDTDFHRAFVSRIRETVAPEHGRTADEATTNRSVDAYLSREYPNLFPAVTGGCAALDGECVAHEEDHGETIHFGPQHRGSVAGLTDVLTHQLVKWDNDTAPTLSVGEEDLDLDGTTQLIAVVERQLGSLRATRRHLAAALMPVATEVARRWTVTTDTGVRVDGYLPAWAENDPSLENVPASRLQLHLSDLTLLRDYTGPMMAVDAPSGEGGKHEVYEREVFRAQIWCSPHDADYPEEREPYGIITVLEDCVMDHLGPDDMATVAAQLRARADAIEQAGYDLAAARADWAKNGGAR